MFMEPASTWFEEGVPVIYGAYTTTGFLDETQEMDALGGFKSMIHQTKILTFDTCSLPGIKASDAIMVDGTNYTVCHVMQVDDGRISKADLQKA
jgi:hypothetical protein